MNDSNTPPEHRAKQQPPEIPVPPAQLNDVSVPLGLSDEDQAPIKTTVECVESLLRQPRRILFQLRQPDAGRVIGALVLITLAACAIYGLIVGAFSGGTQWLAAPTKIIAGLFVSAIICLPSLYIFACLNGSRARLRDVVGLLAGLLALASVMLIGFAPVAWVFSQSTESLAAMGALHLLFWFISAYFGIRLLNAGFQHLDGDVNASGTQVWIVIFIAVTLQMTTALRPILGTADTTLPTEKKFFLSHWSDNMNSKSQRGGTDK